MFVRSTFITTNCLCSLFCLDLLLSQRAVSHWDVWQGHYHAPGWSTLLVPYTHDIVICSAVSWIVFLSCPKAWRTFSRLYPISALRPDFCKLPRDYIITQLAVITADSSGESGAANWELSANHKERHGHVASRKNGGTLERRIGIWVRYGWGEICLPCSVETVNVTVGWIFQ